jgi:hypothetical protein
VDPGALARVFASSAVTSKLDSQLQSSFANSDGMEKHPAEGGPIHHIIVESL